MYFKKVSTSKCFKLALIYLALIYCLLSAAPANANLREKKILGEGTPPKLGNLALPQSQQPGPLISFGQNIVDKGQSQIFLFADDYAGAGKRYIDLIPGFLYGITDNLSIFINVPYAASYQQNNYSSAGIEDLLVQVETAFYNKDTYCYNDQATLVANITLPTGSTNKQPPTGIGSPSFFLGATYSRTAVEWFVFASPGVIITNAKNNNNTKYGNELLYQWGFGRNIKDVNQWIFAWMLEFDGTYTQRNKVRGVTQFNSGGNIIYVTPSFWASSKRVIFQLGLGMPITQNLYGKQPRSSYLIAANLGWTL